MLAKIHSYLVWDQEEVISANMEAKIVAMEQLVEKLTDEMNVLCEENDAFKDNNQDSVQGSDPSANKHQESRQDEGDDNKQEGGKNMQDELCNLKGNYKKMMKKMGSLSSIDQLLISTGLPYSPKVMVVPLLPKFRVPPMEVYDGSRDLLEHFETFNSYMTLHGFLREVACRPSY